MRRLRRGQVFGGWRVSRLPARVLCLRLWSLGLHHVPPRDRRTLPGAHCLQRVCGGPVRTVGRRDHVRDLCERLVFGDRWLVDMHVMPAKLLRRAGCRQMYGMPRGPEFARGGWGVPAVCRLRVCGSERQSVSGRGGYVRVRHHSRGDQPAGGRQRHRYFGHRDQRRREHSHRCRASALRQRLGHYLRRLERDRLADRNRASGRRISDGGVHTHLSKPRQDLPSRPHRRRRVWRQHGHERRRSSDEPAGGQCRGGLRADSAAHMQARAPPMHPRQVSRWVPGPRGAWRVSRRRFGAERACEDEQWVRGCRRLSRGHDRPV
mmetsp:Transcript_51600/g.122147  ORF Transcript_51600/g.122147 Transcript_51600/m.122147 type:complete len:320 (-) Transcript_51600:514-1473(-)